MGVLRRLRGLAGLAISAAIIWAAVGIAIGAAILTVNPASIEPGEGPLMGAGTGAVTRALARRGERLAIDEGPPLPQIEGHAN